MTRLLAIVMMLVAAFPAAAQNCENFKFGFDAAERIQNANRDIIGQDLDQIVERGFITFAAYDDFRPWSYVEGGKPAGVDIDIGRLIAEALGVEAKFILRGAGETVEHDLRNNVIQGPVVGGEVANVMLHVPYDRELGCRNEAVVLTGQYFNETIAIAYDAEKYPEDKPVPAYFRYDKVGVENDSLSDFYLSSIANGQIVPNMLRYPTTADAVEGLRKGEVDAVMGPLGEIEGELGRQDGDSERIGVHSPPLPGLARRQWTLGVAVRFNWRDVSYAVDDAIQAAVEDGRMKEIVARHGLTWTPPEW